MYSIGDPPLKSSGALPPAYPNHRNPPAFVWMELSSDHSSLLQKSWITSFLPIWHSLEKFLLWKSRHWIRSWIGTTGHYVKIKVIWKTDFIQGCCNKREGFELISIEIKGRRFLRLGWESAGGLWGWEKGVGQCVCPIYWVILILQMHFSIFLCDYISKRDAPRSWRKTNKTKLRNANLDNTNKNYILSPVHECWDPWVLFSLCLQNLTDEKYSVYIYWVNHTAEGEFNCYLV